MEPMRDPEPVGGWRESIAVALLVIFVLSTTISGFVFGIRWGFLALGLTGLVASYVVGNE